MGYNGESVSVSIKYGGFQGDQIAKSAAKSGQKIHTIYFPGKENIFSSFLEIFFWQLFPFSYISFEEQKRNQFKEIPCGKFPKIYLLRNVFGGKAESGVTGQNL